MKKGEKTLADMEIGDKGTIARVLPDSRGAKKFADVGLVAGVSLEVEAHAPFGGLIRVKFMDSSMALHSEDAANIIMC